MAQEPTPVPVPPWLSTAVEDIAELLEQPSGGNQFDEIAAVGVMGAMMVGMLGLMMAMIHAWIRTISERNAEEHEELREMLRDKKLG